MRRLIVRHETFPLAGVFRISRGARTEANVVVAEIDPQEVEQFWSLEGSRRATVIEALAATPAEAVIAEPFGLVTPPYGLCLLIACAIGDIKLVKALKDVGIILLPMLMILLIVILFPGLIMFLPRLFMSKFL